MGQLCFDCFGFALIVNGARLPGRFERGKIRHRQRDALAIAAEALGKQTGDDCNRQEYEQVSRHSRREPDDYSHNQSNCRDSETERLDGPKMGM